MKKNVGKTDRILRIVGAVVLGTLYFTGTVTGTAGIVLAVLGGVLLGTAFISFCPIYALVGLNTCPVNGK